MLYHNLIPIFFVIILPPPRSTLFPYTTLFRSHEQRTLPYGSRPGAHGLDVALWCLETTHGTRLVPRRDRKSTRLNSSHVAISYAVFCLKKKKITVIEMTLDIMKYVNLNRI